ncbi:hypothetical protein [Streptomyces sp. CT34]|uniref:hypothetical protein n=1 Tax=Streptomyces sp. CT34 TaxID=1553907 RepID=UPI001F51ABFA|nr:hypothetical protein [Streptomyces sp. CT34]
MGVFEGAERFARRVEPVGDVPKVVFPAEEDAFAAFAVGADGKRVAVPMGVAVDDEAAVPDVVVDVVGLAGGLLDFLARARVGGVGGPGPPLVDRLTEPGEISVVMPSRVKAWATFSAQ